MGATRLIQFVAVVEYVISAIKYLNSHDQLPVDLVAQSVRSALTSTPEIVGSNPTEVTDFSLTSANPISLRVSFHIGLHGGAYGRTEVTS